MNYPKAILMIEAEYAKYKYSLSQLEAIWDKLPDGYLHTITCLGEERHYRYLPPSRPEKSGSLIYLDGSQQALIDALLYKRNLSSDISKVYHNLALFPGFLHDFVPHEEISEELERLSMTIKYPPIRRRRCVSWRYGQIDRQVDKE